MRPVRCLVFDLDDTLMDTNRKLVPAASREACQAMIEAGLTASLTDCLNERLRFIQTQPRGNVYQHLTKTFGVLGGRNSTEVEEAGFKAFHDRKVGTEAELFEGARDVLEALSQRYRLYLVTQGNEATQRQKVELVNIAPFFSKIFYVDPKRGETKTDAFRAIAALEGGEPSEFMSVGNRVDTDISTAKSLGWKTCWVRTGEYTHMSPASQGEMPDFEISRIGELSARCQL